jgi:nucleotide-binding universal stress UspA family protein
MSPAKIAVGIDFSLEAEAAARHALDLARATGAELYLVHVAIPVADIPPLTQTPSGARALDPIRAYLTEALERDRARLGEMRERLSRQGVTVRQALIEGHPDSGLCTAARELGAELTVVGTHGRTGLRWFLLGSVAQRVIRMSDTDVLIARGERGATGGYRRIAVATDFSPSSERALDRARRLAAPDAEIDVIHFYQHAPRVELYDAVRSAIGADLTEALLSDLRAAGQSFIGQKREQVPTIRFYAVAEPPVPGIIHWLERNRYDLVALGSHGRRGFRRFLLGSVAEAVARRAPSSALIAHGRLAESGSGAAKAPIG